MNMHASPTLPPPSRRNHMTIPRALVRALTVEISEITGVPVHEINDRRRTPDRVNARRLLIWTLVYADRRSPTRTARALGLDHTTVMYHLETVGDPKWKPTWRARAALALALINTGARRTGARSC